MNLKWKLGLERKFMKKQVRILLSLVMCIGLSVPVFASTVDSEKKQTFNELELYLGLKDCTDNELRAKGLSENEMSDFRDFSMEEAYLKRAELPIETLVAYGYNDEQIEILKAYDGSAITADSSVMKAASDMEISEFEEGSASGDEVEIEYHWMWNIVPVWKTTDTIAVYWEAHDKKGYKIDLDRVNNYADVMYYNIATGKRASSQDEHVNGSYSSTENVVSVKIDMAKKDNQYWAKKGIYYVTLSRKGSEKIGDVDFGVAYGHSRLNALLDFFLHDDFSLEFCEEGLTKVDRVSNISCTYDSDAYLDNHGEFPTTKDISKVVEYMLTISYIFCLVGALFIWPLIAVLLSDIIHENRISSKIIVFLSLYTLAFVIVILNLKYF